MTLNEIFKISLATYILGLFWYRFSDYLLIRLIEEPDERFWVVQFNLKRPRNEMHLGEL
jgi:hypothetical protein